MGSQTRPEVVAAMMVATMAVVTTVVAIQELATIQMELAVTPTTMVATSILSIPTTADLSTTTMTSWQRLCAALAAVDLHHLQVAVTPVEMTMEEAPVETTTVAATLVEMTMAAPAEMTVEVAV